MILESLEYNFYIRDVIHSFRKRKEIMSDVTENWINLELKIECLGGKKDTNNSWMKKYNISAYNIDRLRNFKFSETSE